MKRMHTTVSIPKPLYDKIEKYIKNTGFTSVSSYVVFVLRQVLSNLDEPQRKNVFSKSDEEKVKKRLKALGYL